MRVRVRVQLTCLYCVSILAHCEGVGFAGQHPHDGFVTVPRGVVQRRLPILVRHVYSPHVFACGAPQHHQPPTTRPHELLVGTTLDKEEHHRPVSAGTRQVKRRHSTVVAPDTPESEPRCECAAAAVVEHRLGLAPATMSCFHSITDGMAANELCTAQVFAGG